jgi:hypothetical protein
VATHDVGHRSACRRRRPAVAEPAVRPCEAHLLPGRRREAGVAAQRGELGHRPEAAAHRVAEPRVAERGRHRSVHSARVTVSGARFVDARPQRQLGRALQLRVQPADP